MTVHKVVRKKILPRYYDAVANNVKTFELRKDEDDIQVGDVLILREWDGHKYTGRTTEALVKYVLRNVPEYGLMPGHCIVGLKNLENAMSRELLKRFIVAFVNRIMEIQEKGTSYEAIEGKKGTITIICGSIQLTEEDLKAIAIESLMEVLEE